MREAVGGEVSVNRTSADVIPLCSASVPTKSSTSCIITVVIASHAGHRPAKISEDRRGKIAISIPFDHVEDFDIELDDCNSTRIDQMPRCRSAKSTCEVQNKMGKFCS